MALERVRDITIYYEREGAGDPVVLIMGLGASLDWWGEGIREMLASRFDVLVFDNRGAGRSSRPKGRYSIRQMAEDTLGLMDALGMERAHILGYSMGGMIAQEIAIRHPGRVMRLVLGSTAPGGLLAIPPKPRVLRLMLGQRNEATAKAGLMQILFPKSYIASHPERIDALWELFGQHPTDEKSFLRQLMAIVRWSSLLRLRRIKAPTLIIHGTEDILLPVANGKILKRRIPSSQLVLLPGGHGVGLQRMEEISRLVLDFLLEDGRSTR